MTSSSMIKGGGGKDLVKFGDIYVFTNMSPVATNFLDLQVRELYMAGIRNDNDSKRHIFGIANIQNDILLFMDSPLYYCYAVLCCRTLREILHYTMPFPRSVMICFLFYLIIMPTS